MPRIDSRKCSLDGTKGKNKTDLSTSSKWQIDLIFVVEGSPARCVSERSKGGDYAPGDSKGHTLGAPLVTFPASGKSPGVEGRSALLTGECRGGCAPSHRQARGRRGGAPSSLGTGTAVPQKPQGEGAQRPPHWGAQRGSPRIKTKTILDSSAGLRYTGKKENRRNHHVRKKTGPQRSLLVRQPEKI